MRKIVLALSLVIMASIPLHSQVDITYQKPSKEILQLADVPLPPRTVINNDGSIIVLLYRSQYKSIVELSEPEIKLAGIRTNPVTNMSSRTNFSNNIKVQKTGEKDAVQVKGLPENPRLANFSWSSDQSKLAFTNSVSTGTELWYVDIASAQAYKLTEGIVNANLGSPFRWFKDNNSILVNAIPSNREPIVSKLEAIPQGPVVSVNEGKKAQNRTYQDLLRDKTDEDNFIKLAESELLKVNLNGNSEKWADKAIYRRISFSPDGKYALVSTIKKPFSYLVPYYRFPSDYVLMDLNGNKIKTLEEVPLTEDLPKGFMAERTGKRDFSWRDDQPATLYWAEALDKGDPEIEVEYRDQVLQLAAPFTDQPSTLLKTINRFSGILWGDANNAIAYDYWWNTRNTKAYHFNPANSRKKPVVIIDRNYQDRYSDPGEPVTHKNKWNREVLVIDKSYIYMIGEGYSDKGKRPFIDRFNLANKSTKRLFQLDNNDKLEDITKALDIKRGTLITRIESPTEYPNYYIRNIKSRQSPKQITFFKNPFESMSKVYKEVINYKREDGLPLSGTLYLPATYNRDSKEKLPLIMWAYPKEYKDKSSAGQVTSSANEFTYPYYGSPIYWVMKGYAVLDDAAFPIVGEGNKEPNDSFIKQLVGNAKAAIDTLDKMGYIDRTKVAIGGHSYGAFMTANLLTHSNLFAAGIARSGAYNRTLTPFGFQSEERNYWEAPEIYNQMSPFMHAEKMKHPLLLIHGAEDNNPGTYTMQSERYFNALKGLGATVRLVLLPKESHGYRSRESVLHILWEQDQWLEKYLKNK